jgi:hypothetical protein
MTKPRQHPGFFDLENRHEQLEALGGPLPKLNQVVGPEEFVLRWQKAPAVDAEGVKPRGQTPHKGIPYPRQHAPWTL